MKYCCGKSTSKKLPTRNTTFRESHKNRVEFEWEKEYDQHNERNDYRLFDNCSTPEGKQSQRNKSIE